MGPLSTHKKIENSECPEIQADQKIIHHTTNKQDFLISVYFCVIDQ